MVNTSMNKLLAPQGKVLTLAALALTLSSCSSLGLKMPWSDSDSIDHALISQNLVDVIAQYPKLNPLLATVQVSAPDNAFERQVQQQMSERGYKIERTDAVEGENIVEALSRSVDDDDKGSALYVLSVGELSAERHYAVVNGLTVPTSELVIRGGQARTITLDDDGFADTDAQLSNVVFKADDASADVELPQLAAAKTESSGVSVQNQTAVKRNIYNTRESNYLDVFSEYEDLESNVLVFPNDSLKLGDTNKVIIEQFVEMMDPATDVLSVIGCSHGDTDVSNGNSVLALGRANRVKEAFMFSGIEHDQVLEEGCWAPTTFDEVMPRRGVVLTLKRRKSS